MNPLIQLKQTTSVFLVAIFHEQRHPDMVQADGFGNAMKKCALLFCFLPSVCFAQLGTVTDLHATRSPCPTGFTCNSYTVVTPYTPSISGYADVLEPNVQGNVTDIFFSGSGGTGIWQGAVDTPSIVQSFWNDLANSGHRIIQWAWSTTWSIARLGGLPVYNRMCSDRAATVIAFFQSRYGGNFNVLGSSWGSGEVAFAIANWPITVQKAFIISGPVEMNIAEGCEATVSSDPYYYSPGTAGGVDLFMGLSGPQPCYNRDVSYDQIWRENSVEFGGVYVYPSTAIRIYVGENDSTDIKNRGGFYNTLLQHAGQTHLQFSTVANCGHDFSMFPSGLAALEAELLRPAPTREKP